MTIEAKFTAGPLAENDEWVTPIAVLAEQILNTHSPDLTAPTSVSVQWPEGDELTYRRVSTEETDEHEDEAWVAGYSKGYLTAIDDDQDDDFVQIGWLHENGAIFQPLDQADFVENCASIGWQWEPVYKAA